MNDRIIFKPRTGQEVLKAAPPGTGLYLYSRLAKDPRPALEVVTSLKRNNIILLQDPDDMRTGHWISLSFHPETKEAFFFSSYGGMPDREKMEWISRGDLYRSGQSRNVLNDGLKELALRGWTIHYNNFPFQRRGDKTATCGIWSTAFLNSGVNPDEFMYNHLDPVAYYDLYFRK